MSKQHFEEVPRWGKLEDTQRRDNIKNEWCKKNDIRMLRIPYTEKNDINHILDTFLSPGHTQCSSVSSHTRCPKHASVSSSSSIS